MEAGNRILREIAEKFKEYESRLDLLRWIDREIVDEAGRIDEFFDDLAQRMEDIFHLRDISLYVLTNEIWLPVTTDSPELTMVPSAFADNPCTEASQVQENEDKETVSLFVSVISTEAPPILLVVTDDHIGGPMSALHDQDFQSFVRILAGQLTILLDNRIRRKLEQGRDEVMATFFRALNRNDAGPTACWGQMASLFSGLPSMKSAGRPSLPTLNLGTDCTRSRVRSRRMASRSPGWSRTLPMCQRRS